MITVDSLGDRSRFVHSGRGFGITLQSLTVVVALHPTILPVAVCTVMLLLATRHLVTSSPNGASGGALYAYTVLTQ